MCVQCLEQCQLHSERSAVYLETFVMAYTELLRSSMRIQVICHGNIVQIATEMRSNYMLFAPYYFRHICNYEM